MYEELVEKLRNLAWAYKITQNVNTNEYMLAVEAAHAIEELSKTLDEEVEINTALGCNMPVWIPVTERLPKYGEKCLVHFKLTGHNDFHISVSYCYVQHEGFWSDCGRDYKATHWMPLPEPPKDGE